MLLATKERQTYSPYQKEMLEVLSLRNTKEVSFTVPKGLSEVELLQLMRKRKSETKLHG
jgi:hypothetical protein